MSPTLVYSPSVEIHIMTVDGTLVDLSPDLTSGHCSRIIGGVSSITFNVANANRKYDGMFTPMDRIVCYMRRINRLLVLSGYLDVVPLFTAYPGTVQIQASCSLKRLQNWYWDPTTSASYSLLYGGANNNTSNYAKMTDGGLSNRTIALLTNVAKWPKEQIHIGQVPVDWFAAVQKVAEKFIQQADQADMLATVGAQSYVNGSSAVNMGTTTVTPDGGGTGELPATSGKCSDFGGPNGGAPGTFGLTGEPGLLPDNQRGKYGGPYYCAMRWPFDLWENNGDTKPVPGVDLATAVSWWKDRHILVVNPANNKGVVVRAADSGPAPWTGRVIDLSSEALNAIGVTNDTVHIAFAPDDLPLGPVTVNVNEAAIGASVAADTPAPSTRGQAVCDYERQFVNVLPYVWGGTSLKTGADCSGFQQACFKHFGVNLPRTAAQQALCGWSITAAEAGAGDLVFFHNMAGAGIDHVGLCTGNGMMIAAPHTGEDVEIESIYKGAYGPNVYRRILKDGGGTVPGIDGASAGTGAGSGAGSSTTAEGGGSASTSSSGLTASQVGQALFNVASWLGNANFGGDLLTGIRALMNDTPVITTVQELMAAGLRDFCSAPNGDFIAWFPDYFGWWGTASRMVIEDIEIARNFSVGWSDAALKTHYFVTGSSFSTAAADDFASTGDASAIYQEYSTAGIASVEFPQLMKAMFNVDMAAFKNNGRDFLARYGARPYFEQMNNITGHRQEFFFAVFRFMTNWSQQYAATVNLTFMPEMYPGMLMVLPTYSVQAYVQQVDHYWDMREGGDGFTTNVVAVAWSALSDTAPKGLPKGAPMPTPLATQKKKAATP